MKIKLDHITHVYFIGIGGIGMSALARYFHSIGKKVSGYDKTPSPLTDELLKEGIEIHFQDLQEKVLDLGLDKAHTVVVYTPAIPKDFQELVYLQHQDYTIVKRAAVLGLITQFSKGLGVAGTHGKTTTSTLLAHILHQSSVKCNAFLGGISSNFGSNYLVDTSSPYTVIEADEFDRSFLQLKPFASIITNCDPDHLDIYGSKEAFKSGFEAYAQLISKDGFVVQKYGLSIPSPCRSISYAIHEDRADAFAENLRFHQGDFLMDIHYQGEKYSAIELGLPGIHNAENALACFVMCLEIGVPLAEIKSGLKTFKGVKRRYEVILNTPEKTYIDDYAHHPTEINALVDSLQLQFPNRRLVGVFQPHLFSRTQDFMDDFAKALSRFDELILLPIYPARELPIPHVTSEVLLSKCTLTSKKCVAYDGLLDHLVLHEKDVLVTIGAGDIDRWVPKIKASL